MINVAVWAFHGAKDKNVPVSGSRDIVAAMKRSGGHPRYTEFPSLAHSIYDKVKATPGLLDWMFAQKQK
jgi:dipeptidyl aminopeptidase/acylaminoacyl peptidase